MGQHSHGVTRQSWCAVWDSVWVADAEGCKHIPRGLGSELRVLAWG